MSTNTTHHMSGRRAATLGVQTAIVGALLALVIAFAVSDPAEASTDADSEVDAATLVTADGAWVCAPASEAVLASADAEGTAQASDGTSSDRSGDGSGAGDGSGNASGDSSGNASGDGTGTGSDDGTGDGPGKHGAFLGAVVSVRDLIVWVGNHELVDADVDANVAADVKSTKRHSGTADGHHKSVGGDVDVSVDEDGLLGLDLDALIDLYLDAGTHH